MAISVAVPVGDAAAEAIIERLTPRVRSLKIGPYNDAEADMGPLITAQAKQRVEGLIDQRSEEHTSELQSLMRLSYAVFCLKKKKVHNRTKSTQTNPANADFNSKHDTT